MLWVFRDFSIIYVLTGGGPMKATQTLSIMTYEQAFGFFRMGYASAIGIVTLIICVIASRLMIGRAPGHDVRAPMNRTPLAIDRCSTPRVIVDLRAAALPDLLAVRHGASRRPTSCAAAADASGPTARAGTYSRRSCRAADPALARQFGARRPRRRRASR